MIPCNQGANNAHGNDILSNSLISPKISNPKKNDEGIHEYPLEPAEFAGLESSYFGIKEAARSGSESNNPAKQETIL